MLDLRATYINNNMQDFMAYVIAKEHEMPKIKVA